MHAHWDNGTVFWWNFCLSILFCLCLKSSLVWIIFLMSRQFLCHIYHQPIARGLTSCLACLLHTTSISLLLRKYLRPVYFKKQEYFFCFQCPTILACHLCNLRGIFAGSICILFILRYRSIFCYDTHAIYATCQKGSSSQYSTKSFLLLVPCNPLQLVICYLDSRWTLESNPFKLGKKIGTTGNFLNIVT